MPWGNTEREYNVKSVFVCSWVIQGVILSTSDARLGCLITDEQQSVSLFNILLRRRGVFSHKDGVEKTLNRHQTCFCNYTIAFVFL